MKKFLNSGIGRLRLVGFLEGVSLLLLVLIAMPLKYLAGNAAWVKSIGPVHGVLFLLFVFICLSVAVEQKWSFKTITWKLLLACILPFGTFYVDHAILKDLHQRELGKTS